MRCVLGHAFSALSILVVPFIFGAKSDCLFEVPHESQKMQREVSMGMDMHTKADHHRQRRRTKENDADNSATDGQSNELAQAHEN